MAKFGTHPFYTSGWEAKKQQSLDALKVQVARDLVDQEQRKVEKVGQRVWKDGNLTITA